MDERLDSIVITDLPDGAIDSILSVLCSSAANDKLFYLVYSFYELEESTGWKDVANFRLVCKSFQKVTDRVVPSFALYQQLFNKRVDPSLWITKQEEELTAKHRGFVSDASWFQENGKSCNPLLLPELSSMPLFALESLINVKIHELLISDAALKSMIKIAYAFPNCNTVGFTLTLPNSSLHPGKHLAFQVTNRAGNDGGDVHYIVNRAIVVQVDDSSLAKVFGLAPFKSHLVINEATSYSNGEVDGECFTNACEWIRYLLQVSNAIHQNLPNSTDYEAMQDSMDVDTEVNASEDELLVDEWNRRTEPSRFDSSLPIFSNQSSHSAQLQRMPLLPGSVVNQILYPSNNSLLQLLMMNKLIQFYRLNKCHKHFILSNLLRNNSHPGYQATVEQLFAHLTLNQVYSVFDPCATYIRQFSIHLGAVNEEFQGCHIVINTQSGRPEISFKARDNSFENKIKTYFGAGKWSLDVHEPPGVFATLHLQKILGVSFILPPVDVISIFYAICNAPKNEYMKDDYRIQKRKQYPKLDIAFDSTQVDPSCTLADVNVHEKNGVPCTSLLINNSEREYFYAVLQVLQSNDSQLSYCHIQFGYKTELFSTKENEVSEYHFKTTNQFKRTDLSIELYDYWICHLTQPTVRIEEVVCENGYPKKGYTSINQSHIFNILSLQEESALSLEIFYAESLKSQFNNIKTILRSDKIAAINQIKHLDSLLPDNITVKCFFAKLILQLDGWTEAIKYLHLWIQKRPFNAQLWLTRAKILEKAENISEAAHSYAFICDFPTKGHMYMENSLYAKACSRAFHMFAKLKMWTKALGFWELSKSAQHTWINNLDLEVQDRMMVMQVKKYIRGNQPTTHSLHHGLSILKSLSKLSIEGMMLYVEAHYLLGSHEQMLKLLDKLLAKSQHFDVLIHKAAIFHQLKQFDQAIECYQKAATLTPNQPFDIVAAIDAAKRQQLVPWPFTL